MSGSKSACLFPVAYFAITRLRRPRDFAYLVATSWLPAIWLLWRLTELGLLRSILAFAAGYLAFVSIYEIGYLINDTWDSGRSSGGRKRIEIELTSPFLLAFISIRIGLWLVIGSWSQWLQDPAWLIGFAVLAAATAQHNLVQSRGLRIASFFELAVLRFILPILGPLPQPALPAALLAAMLLYAFPRLLAYMDSKELLLLEQRSNPNFGFLLLLSLAPLMLLIAYLLEMAVLAELTVYYLVMLGLWWAIMPTGAQPAES